MPLREYECQACHRRIEKIKSFSAPPETVCPHCGGELQQTLSAPAIQFKGSGWYVSDYAKSGETKKRSQDGSGEGKSGGNDGGEKKSGAADVSASADKASGDKSSGGSEKTGAAAASPAKSVSAAAPVSSSAKQD
jgi:putative FmdB family regulatory protein